MLAHLNSYFMRSVSHGAMQASLTPYRKPSRPVPTEKAPVEQPAPADAPSGFQVGNKVVWTSSNTEKVGHITHVVPAGKVPSDVGAKVDSSGTPRDHESYVVRGQKVSFQTGLGAGPRANYWPRVSLLSVA